jgi:hypothetical protein
VDPQHFAVVGIFVAATAPGRQIQKNVAKTHYFFLFEASFKRKVIGRIYGLSSECHF